MLFNSFGFLLFFPCVFLLYYALPFRFRKFLLLASSWYFYMCWKPEFIVLILFSTAVDYFCGLGIGRWRQRRGIFLAISLVMNLGLLFFFKYFNFFGQTLTALCRAVSIPWSVPVLDIILPVGISFYTFQTLSYTIDVYRGKLAPERDFVTFALFVSYFPQLVAGPIERAENLLPQLKEEHPFSYDNAVSGLKLMAWGFFKKCVAAAYLAMWVDPVYGNVTAYSGGALVVATCAFALQIYCDFGGYSDIARGCARMMGVELMVNFRSPYFFSHSIGEYWKRNHISLSEWFHQYVYIPLGGKPEGKAEKVLLFDGDVLPQRPLARRCLDLCDVGPLAGGVSHRRGSRAPYPAGYGKCPEARAFPSRFVHSADVCPFLLLPDLLPGGFHGRCPLCGPAPFGRTGKSPGLWEGCLLGGVSRHRFPGGNGAFRGAALCL